MDATKLQSIACTLMTQMSLIMSISTSTYALRKRRLTSIATNLSNAKVECAQHLSIDLTSATNASVREPITKPKTITGKKEPTIIAIQTLSTVLSMTQ